MYLVKYYAANGAYPRRADLWLIYLFINFVYLANLIVASRMKAITWRGNQYELKD